VLNVSVLSDLVGDDPGTLRDLLQLFQNSAAAAMNEFDTAWQARQLSGLVQVSHRIKSSARFVGAVPLAELCASLEQLATQEDIPGCEAILPQVYSAIELVNDEISRYLEDSWPNKTDARAPDI